MKALFIIFLWASLFGESVFAQVEKVCTDDYRQNFLNFVVFQALATDHYRADHDEYAVESIGAARHAAVAAARAWKNPDEKAYAEARTACEEFERVIANPAVPNRLKFSYYGYSVEKVQKTVSSYHGRLVQRADDARAGVADLAEKKSAADSLRGHVAASEFFKTLFEYILDPKKNKESLRKATDAFAGFLEGDVDPLLDVSRGRPKASKSGPFGDQGKSGGRSSRAHSAILSARGVPAALKFPSSVQNEQAKIAVPSPSDVAEVRAVALARSAAVAYKYHRTLIGSHLPEVIADAQKRLEEADKAVVEALKKVDPTRLEAVRAAGILNLGEQAAINKIVMDLIRGLRLRYTSCPFVSPD